jgi:O-antigen/teichoic acid export membrane protein
MGVVKHQSLRSSILIYLGFAIGALNTLLLFPVFVGSEQFGLTRIISDIGVLLVPFCTFSTGLMVNRFYPYYAYHLEEKRNDLMGWVLVTTGIGLALFVAGSLLFKGLIIRKYDTNSHLLIEYYYFLYPFVSGIVLFSVFESYSWSRHETVAPNFLKELLIRLLTTAIIGLYALKVISFVVFMWLFCTLYFVALLLLVLYLWRKKLLYFTLKVSNVTSRLYKRMTVYALSITSATIFNLLSQNIGALIVASISGLEEAAYMTIAYYMAMLIQVPQRSISAIATPIIAQSWKDKNMAKIDEIYKKSSILQLVAALFIFWEIWLNINDIYRIMPAGYDTARDLVFFMGLTKIVDMGTGVNQQLLSTSRFWRFDLTSATVLVILSIPLNIFLIKKFGMVGAGYSLMLSQLAFNGLRLIFIKRRFGLQPFSLNTLKAIVISIAAYYLSLLVPGGSNPFVGIIIHGTVFLLLFGGAIWLLNVSEDINNTVAATWKKVFK